MIQNLKGVEKYVDQRDLFTGPFWNFFDWVNIDQAHQTVLHNSFFVVGAIDAALKEADVLHDTTHVAWLKSLRARLVGGINRLWDDAKQAYPDSIHGDGTVSSSICQHTSFLSLLYDVVPKEHALAAINNVTNPPPKMVKVGSPFAALYLYEACEKLGLDDVILREIYQQYLPMVEAGATTVWESFPTGTTGGGGFPTRSHTHAWSSAPSRFLNRIVLGVKDTAPAAATVQISPRLNGLTWAHGTTATASGTVQVDWKFQDNTLTVTYYAPTDVKATFVEHDKHKGLKVVVNGKEMAVYFARPVLQMILKQPFTVANVEGQFDVFATVAGGGLSGQAGAVKHGISKALQLYEPSLRGALKTAGFLTRDSRVVERKKYGKAKARKSFQFSKR